MAVPAVLNPPAMYRVRPYFDIKKVKLPDCMYLMKPVHQLPNMVPSTEGSQSALSYLENRQEWVLTQIGRLQERMKVMANDLGLGPADVGILQQVTPGSTLQDVVISCPPSSPPYAILALYKYISECVPCSCRVHIHSSATSTASDDLRGFFANVPSTSKPQLVVTLVWKSESVCPSPTMVVSPHNQTPVEGVANIARYLCREFCPNLYEGLGPETASQVDSWLDTVTRSLSNGTSKEKTSVLRRLNSHLGSASYLVGEGVTLADIVVYSAMCSQDGLKPTANVKRWMKRLQLAVPALACIPCSLPSN